METKGIIKVKKDSKLGMYRYLMEKAMACEKRKEEMLVKIGRAMNFGMINIILNG